MTDDFGRPEHLVVQHAHRAQCAFGTGFFRVSYRGANGPQVRYCQDQAEVAAVHGLLRGVVEDLRTERDGYCLDGDQAGDARTPDVVDAELWLGLPVREGMAELGLTSEADYLRVYAQVEQAVYRRDNRERQSGVHASIVLKRRGASVTNIG